MQIKEVPDLDPMNNMAVASETYNALQHDHTYTHSLQHPLTHTFDRWIQTNYVVCTILTKINIRYVVGDRFYGGPKTSGHKKDICKYHHMNLCPQLTT
jgi:hypothetical protein